MPPLPFPPLHILLHAGGPDPTGPLWSNWTLEPSVVLGLFALAAAYVYAVGPANRRRADAAERVVTAGQRWTFFGGLLTLFVALGPPLDDWSDHYLLSAHMGQHLLLTLLAPPLLLAGTPGWLLAPLARRPIVNRIGYALTRPLVAFVLFNAVFILWHMPVFYDAALATEPVHVLEHGMFIGTALLAWWPAYGPLGAWPRLSPLPLCLYYFAQTIPGSIVGAFILFAQAGLYVPYNTARRIFGIDLQTDQQIAGLLMWVVSSTIYLGLITVTFFRYASSEEAKERGEGSEAPSSAPSSAPGHAPGHAPGRP